jgi:ABC-type glycerol-3-phosphate transport system permease component
VSEAPSSERRSDAASAGSAAATIAEISSLEDLVSDVQAGVSETREDVDDYLARTQATDRSLLAKIVVWLFLVACLVTVAFVVVAILAGFAVSEWDTGAERLIQLLSSVILPVVTLVIGYYFGTEQNRRPPGG